MVWSYVGLREWTSLCALVLLCMALPGCQAFLPNFWSRVLTLSWDSYTHQYMTEKAILNVTMATLSSFLRKNHYSKSQEQIELGRRFWQAVREVVQSNSDMDFLSSTRSDPVYHFDSERVEGATELLREFWAQTVLLTKAKEYQGARSCLGQLLHSLQDFYSHSNWVEMGQRSEYHHLLDPKEPGVPVASEDMPTCIDCPRATCYNNLLEELTLGERRPVLTTGYFSDYPVKPQGKCSHGGILDSSHHQEAKGGINKDSTSFLFSPHHYLHKEAARLATMATLTVLRDLRDVVGPERFLRLFSVQQPPALVFVMDTTGSMFEEITAARMRAFSIIQARAQAQSHGSSLPGTFLLVPFHDPAVGPVYETDDPDQFIKKLEDLTALGGGDEPEMCLSAIQLALTNSPPLSEVFVFTDASPKDEHLFNAVKALALEKQSKVTFLLTVDERLRRKRETLSPERFSLYSSLSSVSGGMTIFTSKKDIRKVSAVVQDNTEASKVSLLHVDTESDSLSSYSFSVDRTMRNVTLHLTSQSELTHCDISSSKGTTQSLLSSSGPLAKLESYQGLYRISLLPPIEPGQWQLTIRAQGNIKLNVIGDSSLDFLYYFAVESNETHPGLARVEGSPVAGAPVFLVVVITGLSHNEGVSFRHVTLLGTNGESLQQVFLNSSSSWWSGEELVGHLDSVPRMPFSLRLSGSDRKGNKLDRVSTEIIHPTHVQIQVLSAPHLSAGQTSTVVFEVQNHGPAGHFSLSAKDDSGYLSKTDIFSLSIKERGSVRHEMEIKTPKTAQAGQAVTLTVTVTASDNAGLNYAVVHLTVLPEEPDASPPSCSTMRVEMACPPVSGHQCSQGNWSVSLAVRDRGNSGLASIQLSQGMGTLTLLNEEMGVVTDQQWNHKKGAERGIPKQKLVYNDPPLNLSSWVRGKSLRLRYTSGCCSPRAELLLQDGAGNTRRCLLISSQQRVKQERNVTPSRATRTLTDLVLLGLVISRTV